MSESQELYIETENPAFLGKRLNLPEIRDDSFEQGVVHRAKNTVFSYFAWPSVCIDEEGVLYATSAAFGTSHVCPFFKYAMYVSRSGGKSWTPPIVIADARVPQGHGGIISLGGGKMLANRSYLPGDVMYQDMYTRINDTMYGRCGTPSDFGLLRQTMVDLYPYFDSDELVGGSYVMLSDDGGVTWDREIRMPIQNIHGPCVLNDGTILFVGKEYYAETDETYRVFDGGSFTRFHAKDWSDYVSKIEKLRNGRESRFVPVHAYASSDGGVTWEKRATLDKPDFIGWQNVSEAHTALLPDGSLLCALRVEFENKFENDFTTYLTRSSDGGFTWSEWECTHIPGSPAHLLVHSTGVLICSVGRRDGEHSGVFAYVSNDGGHTWDKKYLLSRSEDEDMGYPSTAELPDGSLITVYYQHYHDPKTDMTDCYPSILCTKWTL